MTTWVKLKNQQGQHWDSRIGWGIKLDETKELPDDIPAGSITAERLRMGGLIKCDPPVAGDRSTFTTTHETVQAPVDKRAESLIGAKNEAKQTPEPPGPPPKQTVKKKSSARSTSRWGKKN